MRAKNFLATMAVFATVGSACFLGGNATTDGGGVDASTVLPFQADSPFVYVAKVKNILTGLAPTQTEVDSVANAPDQASKQAALVTLIDAWMQTPQYTQTMMTFFQLAFQQTQISQVDFSEVIPNGNGSIGESPNVNLLIQNVRESFARTVIELIAEKQPLTAAFTTTRFMMTPALAELYAFMDWNQTDDNEKITDKFATQFKTIGVTVEDTTPITYADTLDSTKPATYMHWYFPGLNTIQPAGPNNPSPDCQADTRSWISTNNANTPSAHLVHYLLYGALESYKINSGPPPNNDCNAFESNNTNAIITADDFANTSWKMVNVAPANGGNITPFWDMNKMRAANDSSNPLVMNIPRVGFFSTPAFHANWQTNTSNQMRVTVNQSFIVALGAQVDGSDTTNPGANPPGMDPAHMSAGGAPCVGCHQILDPSRSILLANYSDAYGAQSTTAESSVKGEFVFNGVINTQINTLTDFGNQLATHPLFPTAWVEKLCFFVNSQPCDPTDPEFIRIRDNFKNNQFQWPKLVEDLLSSPLTTNAVATQTTQVSEGELVSVSRRDHLCTLINSRLGLVDSCGLDIVTTKSLVGIPEIAAGLPSDGYGRGAPIPVLPTSPTLFYRAGLENICEAVANEIIDSKTPPPAPAVTYSSANSTAAIADFVATIMAIVPDDPRSTDMTTKLTAHYTAAIAQKATPTDALKSTFVVACLSPNVAGIGM